MLIRYVIALIMKVAIIGCSYFGKELNELGIATPNPYINSAVYRKIILLFCRLGLPFSSFLYKKRLCGL